MAAMSGQSPTHHLWEGISSDNLTEILNDDGTPPSVVQIASSTETLLALGLNGIELTAIHWEVTIASSRFFSYNDNIWLSRQPNRSDAARMGILKGSIRTENRSNDGGSSPNYTKIVLFKN